MSYILDAINKAEKQRRQEREPILESLATAPVTRRRPGIGMIFIILVIALAIGGGIYFHQPITQGLAVVTQKGGDYFSVLKGYVAKTGLLGEQQNVQSAQPQANQPLQPQATQAQQGRSLTAAQQQRINQLRIDVVSFSNDDTKRFIMSGANVLREGDTINGLPIRQIRTEGVVVDLDGQSVLVTP